jgi:hypothetical protein
MMSLRARASCALALCLSVAVPAAAQQVPDLPAQARIKVWMTPLGQGPPRGGVGYLERVDADSLHFRLDRSGAAQAVPWEQVRSLKVSDGQRFTPLDIHLLRITGASAFGAALGWMTWHSCSEQPEEKIFKLDCIVTPRRLGGATEGGAVLAGAIGLIFSLSQLKEERWREVRTPGAVRLSVRRAGGGVGVGVAIAF